MSCDASWMNLYCLNTRQVHLWLLDLKWTKRCCITDMLIYWSQALTNEYMQWTRIWRKQLSDVELRKLLYFSIAAVMEDKFWAIFLYPSCFWSRNQLRSARLDSLDCDSPRLTLIDLDWFRSTRCDSDRLGLAQIYFHLPSKNEAEVYDDLSKKSSKGEKKHDFTLC